MNEKEYSESQIMMFVAFVGLGLLILLPVSSKILKDEEQRKYQTSINNAIEASKKWLSNQSGDSDNYYVDINELIKSKLLKKSNLTGCVKINYNSKTNDHIYSYINQDCENVITIKDVLISSLVTNGDGLYKEDSYYIYKGINPDNYIIINNQEYRILSIDDSGIKLITSTSIASKEFDSNESRNNENNPYCLDSINGCNIYMGNGIDTIDDSDIYEYLENVYSNISNNLVKTNWDLSLISEVNDEIEENTITSNIGLLTVKDYIRTNLDGKYNHSWLNNGEDYWTFTGYKNNNYEVWYITSKGNIGRTNSNKEMGVRPIININSNIKVNGNGTKEDPYTLR